MSDGLAALVGAVAGLILVLSGNVFVLPQVLRQQAKRAGSARGLSVFGRTIDRSKLANLTRFSYRVTMPILFSLVGAVSGVAFLGGHE